MDPLVSGKLIAAVSNNHSPTTRHSQNTYAMKPVPSAPRPIRPSQTKTVKKIDTAA